MGTCGTPGPDELIYEEIARRRTVPDLEQREDVLSMVLVARDEDGEALTDQELRASSPAAPSLP
jgi:cytochrome P450